MEFGAMQCVPTNPNCGNCIFKKECCALNKKLVNILPIKSKKSTKKNRFFNYLVMRQGEHIYLNKRDQSDIWKSLYQFPLIESKKRLNIKELNELVDGEGVNNYVENNAEICFKEQKQVLTHQKIYATFIELNIPSKVEVKNKNLLKVEKTTLDNYPFPKIISTFIMENNLV
jgi:A/G-specific adenine glycosylase